MNEDARITCGQLNLHPSPSSLTPEHCLVNVNEPSDQEFNLIRAFFVSLVNVSFAMSEQLTTNVTTTMSPDSLMSPPKTIAGVSVETFSYIFLAIGGAAPVIFLIVVVISMKCHKYRKLKRLRKYQSRQNVTRSLWDLERKQYFKSHAKPPGYKSYMDTAPDRIDYPYDFTRSNSARTGGSTSQYSGHVGTRNVTVSNSNPDVYFRETPVSHIYAHDRVAGLRRTHIRTGSLPSNTSHSVPGPSESQVEKVKRGDVAVHSPNPPPSINSEEALALQSFDKIYQDFDMEYGSSSYTTSSSENRHRLKARPKKVGRYQQDAARSSVVPSRSNLNAKKVITVDLHYTHPVHSGAVISEESSSKSSESSESSSRPNTLPLLPHRELNGHQVPKGQSQNAPKAASAKAYNGLSIHSRKEVADTAGQPHGSFTNTAYLKQDTPDSPDVEITRL